MNHKELRPLQILWRLVADIRHPCELTNEEIAKVYLERAMDYMGEASDHTMLKSLMLQYIRGGAGKDDYHLV